MKKPDKVKKPPKFWPCFLMWWTVLLIYTFQREGWNTKAIIGLWPTILLALFIAWIQISLIQSCLQLSKPEAATEKPGNRNTPLKLWQCFLFLWAIIFFSISLRKEWSTQAIIELWPAILPTLICAWIFKCILLAVLQPSGNGFLATLKLYRNRLGLCVLGIFAALAITSLEKLAWYEWNPHMSTIRQLEGKQVLFTDRAFSVPGYHRDKMVILGTLSNVYYETGELLKWGHFVLCVSVDGKEYGTDRLSSCGVSTILDPSELWRIQPAPLPKPQ
ncbi:MAG: hypothetical protein HN909_02945 [Phycisphaerales bacterium]|nr:hypothetical protein [Phycisphaerales bacterium]